MKIKSFFFFFFKVTYGAQNKDHLHPFHSTFMSSKRFKLPGWASTAVGMQRFGGVSFFSVQSGPLPAQIKVSIKVDESPALTIIMEEMMLFLWSKKEGNCYFD